MAKYSTRFSKKNFENHFWIICFWLQDNLFLASGYFFFLKEKAIRQYLKRSGVKSSEVSLIGLVMVLFFANRPLKFGNLGVRAI